MHIILFIIGTACLLECCAGAEYCDPPPPVENAHVQPSGPWVKNDAVEYVCDEGYAQEGMGRGKCTIDKGLTEWQNLGTGTFPPPDNCTIEYLTCPSPGDVPFSSMDPAGNWSDGDTVKYACDPGYIMIGEESAKCIISNNQQTYEWRVNPSADEFPPECKFLYNDCPSPGNITDGTIVAPKIWGSGETIVYECDAPLVMVGLDAAVCSIALDKFSYEWLTNPVNASDFPPECVIGFDFCPSPGDIGNGSISASTPGPWLPSDTIMYQCDSQYVLIGTDQAECYIPYNKSWYEWRTTPDNVTDFPPECKYRYDFCPSPGELVGNGSFNTTGPWADSDILQYTCDPNYVLFGVSQGECDISDDLTSYQWNIHDGNPADFPPTCKLAICDEPPSISHGTVQTQRPLHFNLSHVVFVCEPGYRIRGPRYATCRIDLNLTWVWEPEKSVGKKWFPYPPECYIHIPHPIHYIATNQHTGISRKLFEFLMVSSLLTLPVLVWLIGVVSWWLYRFSTARAPTVIRRLPWSQGYQNHIVPIRMNPAFPEETPLVRPKSLSPLPETPEQSSATPSMFSVSPSPSPSLVETPRISPSNISPSPTWSILSPSPPPSPTPPPSYRYTPPSLPPRPKAKKPRPLNIPNHPRWMPHANPIRNDMYHLQSITK